MTQRLDVLREMREQAMAGGEKRIGAQHARGVIAVGHDGQRPDAEPLHAAMMQLSRTPAPASCGRSERPGQMA